MRGYIEHHSKEKHPTYKYFQYLILENFEDVEAYIEIDRIVKTKLAMKFFIAFCSQSFRTTIGDYLAHEMENSSYRFINGVSYKLSYGYESRIGLATFIEAMDDMMSKNYFSLRKQISLGKSIRVNIDGGSMPIEIEDIGQFDLFNVDEKQMTNHILNLPFDNKIVIEKPIVILENGNYIGEKFGDEILINIKKKDDVQGFVKFKSSTILWKKEDWFKFFQEGLESGLTTIAFITDGQDITQLNEMQILLEALMSKYPHKELNIIYKVRYNRKMVIETKLPNIKMTKIE